MKHPMTDTINFNCNAIATALKESGARMASIAYSGGGGEHSIYNVNIHWEGDAAAEPAGIAYHVPAHLAQNAPALSPLGVAKTADLDEAMHDLCLMVIEASGNGDYMNEDGGGGTLTVINDGSAHQEHYDTFTNSESSESTFDDKDSMPNLRIFSEMMKASGISAIHVEYSGYGDSGESMEVTPTWKDKPSKLPAVVTFKTVVYAFDEKVNRTVEVVEDRATNFMTAAQDFAAQLIVAAGHRGYENGAGGRGDITITAEGRAIVEHADHYEDSKRSFYSFNTPEPEAASELAAPQV